MAAVRIDELGEREPLLAGGTVALGFFDGCHLGHQQILSLCLQRGGEDGAGVLTFPDHPGSSIPGRQPPDLLTTTEERIALLNSLGLQVFLKTFDREFSTWSAERFAQEILVRRLGVHGVVVGHDYRFGHRAAGDVEKLQRLGDQFGFQTTVVPPVLFPEGEPLVISSTKIRQAVAEGELGLAEQLLGRPYSVRGLVRHGQQRGRTLDFPTANLLFPAGKIRPPHGVMAIHAVLADGRRYPGVANFGLRPTVEVKVEQPLLEAHLFDFSEDLYGQLLGIEVKHFLRPERKFESFAALADQIKRDATQAREALNSGA